MTTFEILPTKASFAIDDSIAIDVRGQTGPGEFTIWRLGEEVLRVPHQGNPHIAFGWLPAGSYGVELAAGGRTARTAVEVIDGYGSSLRYGFVVDYSPGRDLAGVSDLIRRLHLNAVQFYDWAYRHADLLGGGETYQDALSQPISLQSVRDLIGTVKVAGSKALGYAAVYAVGPEEWSKWSHRGLLKTSGEPFGLGDFLFLVDPASPDWLESFTSQLVSATSDPGFDGFHLDQYGYPKVAVTPDGAIVDLSESFCTLIDRVRAEVPTARLVFNNVNDFPTWATASTDQDAVYIEVWPPHVDLGSLAAVVTRAKSLGSGKPIVVAAYQHVYDGASATQADLATGLTMATLFSHGATQLLAGEADRILVDPYYVRNHVAEQSTADLLRRWYDFAVENASAMFGRGIIDVTGSYAGQYNDEFDVSFDDAAVSETPVAGAVWRRITKTPVGMVMHLINLVGQVDTEWDSPRRQPKSPGLATVRIRRIGRGLPRIRVADPDGAPRFVEVVVRADGEFAIATLPESRLWQVILIDGGISTTPEGSPND